MSKQICTVSKVNAEMRKGAHNPYVYLVFDFLKMKIYLYYRIKYKELLYVFIYLYSMYTAYEFIKNRAYNNVRPEYMRNVC